MNTEQEQLLSNLFGKKLSKKPRYLSDEESEELGLFGGGYCPLSESDDEVYEEEDE